jgi:hypothetical protein
MFQSSKEAREFLKRLGYLKQMRVLEGEEREKTLTMLRLMPGKSSNNQRYWTESWTVGNISYELTTGEDLDELVEIIEDDI